MVRNILNRIFKNKVPGKETQHDYAEILTRHTEESLPPLSVTVTTDNKDNLNFVAPNPDYNAKLHNVVGAIVGTAEFGISPLNDTVFLYRIDILPLYQRQGYALAFLVHLANHYSLPITPIKQITPARRFWESAHQFKASNFVLLDPLGCSELDEEKSRWAHMVPESEAERAIREYKESDEYKSRFLTQKS